MEPTDRTAITLDRLLLLAAAAIVALTLVARLGMTRSYDLSLSGEEQNVVHGILKMGLGTPLYTDPERAPFDVIQYTPGFYYLVTGIRMTMGTDAADPRTAYLLARSAGLVLNLLFAVMAFVLARRLGSGPGMAALWAAVLFSQLPRQVLSRPDALHLALFAASMLFFFDALVHEGARKRSGLALAVMVACCAVLAKQSGALALFIIGGHLLLTRQWALLARQVLIGAAVLLPAFGLLAWHYDGQVLFKNIVTGIQNGPHASIWTWVDQNVRPAPRMIAQLIGIVLAVRMVRTGDERHKALGTGIILSWAFAVFTTMKHGSSPGYHSENLFLLAALMPTLRPWATVRKAPYAQAALVLLALSIVRYDRLLAGAAGARGLLRPVPESAAYRDARAMAAEFRSDRDLREGLVFLTAHDHLEHFLIGRSAATQKDIVCLATSRAHYDFGRLSRAMANGDIRIILSRDTVDVLPFFGNSHPPLRALGVRHGYHLYVNTAAEAGTRPGQ